MRSYVISTLFNKSFVFGYISTQALITPEMTENTILNNYNFIHTLIIIQISLISEFKF